MGISTFKIMGFFVFLITVNQPVIAVASDLPKQAVKYTIPTNDAGLDAFAVHNFDIKWISLSPGSRIFKYDLPVELDGIGQDILLTEAAPNLFEGEKATASCADLAGFECTMKYKNLETNQLAAQMEILKVYANDPIQREGRLLVSAKFISDPEPAGVLLSIGEIEEK